MHVVRGTGVSYYVEDLVPGRAEETLVAGESPGRWTGRGSADLGLHGPVGVDGFGEVLAGRDPRSGQPLRRDPGQGAVAGVDLLFCAPKGVSLLHLLGPRELAEAAGAAHSAAVADAVGSLERTGLGVRRTHGGATVRMPATGAVAAGFVHRTSRALDPHLHTHLVVANVALGVDGRWSTVDSRRLFRHRRAVDAVYGASLRHELTSRAGAAWERGRSGRWDVAGVDPVLLRVFSQRSATIDEYAFRAGGRRSTTGHRRVGFHVDRPAKDRTPTVDGLRTAWHRRAADLGLRTADLVDVVGRSRHGPADGAGSVDHRLLVAQLDLVAGRRSTLGRQDLVAAVAEASPNGMPAAQVEAVAAALGRSSGGPGGSGLQDRSGAEWRWDVRDVAAVARDRVLDDHPVPAEPDRPHRSPGHDAGALHRGTVRDLASDGWDRDAPRVLHR